MNIIKDSKSISIQLEEYQLWFLISLFGPGWVFGIEDPTKGLQEKEIEKIKKEAIAEFESKGLMEFKGGNELTIDEMLGGMAYSLVNADNLIIVKNLKTGRSNYFFFLPQWQVELTRIDGEYQVTYLKDRANITDRVLDNIELNHKEVAPDSVFHIIDKYFELAISKYEDGEIKEADKILAKFAEGDINNKSFIHDYQNSQYHLVINLIIGLKNDKFIAKQKYELINSSGVPYWVSHDPLGESGKVSMSFTPMTSSEIKQILDKILPKK